MEWQEFGKRRSQLYNRYYTHSSTYFKATMFATIKFSLLVSSTFVKFLVSLSACMIRLTILASSNSTCVYFGCMRKIKILNISSSCQYAAVYRRKTYLFRSCLYFLLLLTSPAIEDQCSFVTPFNIFRLLILWCSGKNVLLSITQFFVIII